MPHKIAIEIKRVGPVDIDRLATVDERLARDFELCDQVVKSKTPMRSLFAKLGWRHCGQVDALDEDDPELFFVNSMALTLLGVAHPSGGMDDAAKGNTSSVPDEGLL